MNVTEFIALLFVFLFLSFSSYIIIVRCRLLISVAYLCGTSEYYRLKTDLLNITGFLGNKSEDNFGEN